MTSQETSFSFVVTCYNFERYIAECLESIARQNYAPDKFEVVCVNDGSTDGSEEIIKKHSGRFKNFVSLKIENSGLEKACNHGIKASRFDRIVRVDADDVMDPNFLSHINSAVLREGSVNFFYCKTYFELYADGRKVQRELPDFGAEEIFNRGDFFATGTVYQKKDLLQVGLFPEKIKNCGLENYSVILALLAKEKKGLAVSEASFFYRRHDSNMSTLRRGNIIQFGHQLLASYGRTFKTNENHPYGLVLFPSIGNIAGS